MKAPQNRKTKKRVERDRGLPPLVLDGDENGIAAYEQGEDRWPARLKGEEEVRLVRDFCDAWLDENENRKEEDD